MGVALVVWGLVLAYSADPAHAAPTICVVGGACHPSLQAAIDAANAGDTIEIGAGEDTEAGIVISKNLTIRGQSASQSIVQAAASPSTATNRVFVINNGVTATLEDLTVRYGYFNGNGGGISNNGTLTLQRVTVSQNGTRDASTCGISSGTCFAADGGEGGGISDIGSLTMSNSTLSGNQTGLDGTCNVTDGCFSENNAGFGGGLAVDLEAADLNNVTITNNRGNGAGGIHHFTGGGPFRIFLTLNNSIVAGNLNTNGQPADCNSVSGGSGGIISEGYNLVGAGTGCPSGGTGDLTTSDPKLGALADNGGPTKTHALLTDSPAIDAGPPTSGDTICPPPSTDQRGVVRPQDGNADSTPSR